ncbi:hypothetical protein I5L47_04730 [Serratia marcescens]|nr:hypothetical protein [Serratia marcescens]
MATPIQKKAEEKYVKGDTKKPGDGTETDAGSAAGDGTETDAGSAAGDGAETDAGSAAGDGTETDAGSAAGDDTETGTDTKPHWFTVQVVRSPSGRRFRAGIEFTSEPKTYDFSLFSAEQLKALAADPFLRIKPFTPAEE